MTAADEGNESRRTVHVGQDVLFRLPENPSTGYVWEFHQTGTGVLHVAEDRFEPGGSGAPGAGGQRVLRLVGERSGTVQVQAVQRRAWEPPGQAVETRTFTVVVE